MDSVSQGSYEFMTQATRLLAENVTGSQAPTTSPTSESDALVQSNDTEIILDTLRIYGSMYCACFLIFCVVRRRYPKLYNLRSWVPEMKSELAITQSYGFFSWAWKVFEVDDDTLLTNIGMDGLCFIRALRLGAKLSFCGMLNSLWLIPMFWTAVDSPETDYLTDPFSLMSVANLPSGSPRFAGVVLGAYVILFCCLHLVTKEFNWFIIYRHKFLSQRIPHNYAIYVSGIPESLRSNYALTDFFQNGPNTSVVEAQMAMDIPSLAAKVVRRETVIEKIEHTLAEEKKKGIVKTHRTFKLKNTTKQEEKVTEKVQSVETYRLELRELNNDIASAIGKVTNQNDRMRHFMVKSKTKGASKELKDDEETLNGSRLKMLAIESEYSDDGNLEPIVENSPTKLSTLPDGVPEDRKDVESERQTDSETLSSRISFLRQDSAPHPFLQIFGLDSVPDTTMPSEGSATTGFSQSGSNESGQISRDEASREETWLEARTGEPSEKDDRTLRVLEELKKGQNTLESNTLWLKELDASQKIAPQSSEKTTALEKRTSKGLADADSEIDRMEAGEKTNQGLSRSISIGSRDSSRNSRSSRLKQRTSTSANRLSSTLRNSVNVVENVKKVADLGVHGAKKAADLGVQRAKKAADLGVHGMKKAADLGVHGVMKAGQLGVQNIQRAPALATKLTDTAAAVAPMLRSQADGAPREAGFVAFRDLYSTQASRQMLQHPSPSKMLVEPAPNPEEIFWRNVGLPSKARKTGRLLSLAATTALCFFWSIPVAFISSLTEVNSLKEKLPLLGKWVEAVPSLENILALIAPLLLLALNEGILPSILTLFSTWEGHIAWPQLEASTFVKLSAFVIIQTFFVSTISGSISAEIANILDDPGEVINLLANSLPVQSSYFIQIVLVFTFFVQGLELLRVTPLSMALVRRFVGPKLTVKERRKSWRFLQSLEDPAPFFHAEVFAQLVLFYVVFFVYSSIAPIACLFLCMAFLICESGYRYHFIHNHKISTDSGGKIWVGFIRVFMASMLIGQLTLIGFLILKKAVYAIPALAPMLALTTLYMVLVSPRKLHASNHLPTIQCVELDRAEENSNVDFLLGKYLQPALQQKRLYPDEDVKF